METTIQLGHGSGGLWTNDLVRAVFLKHFDNEFLRPLGDAAHLPALDGRLAMTTDSFVVSPLFFPGGDIGSLAVNGTVNDLAVGGAVPRFLTCGVILEEGLALADLDRAAASMAAAARAAGVLIVAGDTKVVERGKGDGIFVNTAGLGILRPDWPPVRGPHAGDTVLVSGTVGDHGAVVLSARSGVELSSALTSDCAPVFELVDALFTAGITPLFLRDPTRGGLAGVLHELASDAALEVRVEEAALPVRADVAAVCDVLGVDPLHLANEGKVVAVVPGDQADRALAAWRARADGRDAAILGTLGGDRPGRVTLRTRYGGGRILDRPVAEPLPRIC